MKAMMSLLVGRNRGKAVCILAWQLTKVAAMANVREIEREGYEEVESGQGKYSKQAFALDLILRLNNHRSYSDSHNQRGIYFLECTVREKEGFWVRHREANLDIACHRKKPLSQKVTNLTKLTEAQTDEIVLAEKEEIHKVTRASKHLTDQVTDLRSKLKSGTVNLENQRHKISMIKRAKPVMSRSCCQLATTLNSKKFAATRPVEAAPVISERKSDCQKKNGHWKPREHYLNEILGKKLWHHMSIQRRQENAE
ncbi:hypothetical protein Tco_0700641 [Tanacetum coccineum]